VGCAGPTSASPFTHCPFYNVPGKSEVEFCAHCVLKWGIELGYWEKVGKVADVGKVEVLFTGWVEIRGEGAIV
jgi:hypothetical protein